MDKRRLATDLPRGLFERDDFYIGARASLHEPRPALMAVITGINSSYVLVQEKIYIY